MARIVMKFGGTSMAGSERIRHVAGLVRREAEGGHQVAVVVSAMAGETDRLIQLCREAASLYDPREYDVVVASGEQVTSGLLAITLQGMGLNARSYMGWQLPIRASGHAAGLIEGIDVAVLERVFDENGIAIIPGFQGVAADGSLATLGRGGSDTSAVALAAAMKADRCDIYTDVDGVYTTDPRIVPRARKLPIVTYEEMLELASVGAKVLQTRSVGLAMRYNLPLQVLSSFEDRPGTLIVREDALEDYCMERQLITGIAYDKNEARLTLTGLPEAPGDLRRARRGPHQLRHDRAGLPKRGDLHRPRRRFGAGGGPVGEGQGRDRLCRARHRRGRLQGLDRRRRHPLRPRHRGADVRDPGRTQDRHPRHRHLRDQGLGADPGRLYRARGARSPHRLRSRRGGRGVTVIPAKAGISLL
jgi:uridylate kinase